jgi:hypothetical protein
VNRMSELYVRRRVLIERCRVQREGIAGRVAALHGGPLRWALSGVAEAAGGPGGRHPLAWIAALAGLVLLRRPRQALTVLAWTRTALTVLSRVTQVMGVVAALRRAR